MPGHVKKTSGWLEGILVSKEMGKLAKEWENWQKSGEIGKRVGKLAKEWEN